MTISNAAITTAVDATGKPRQLLLGVTTGAYTFYDAVDNEYLALTSDGNKLHSSTSSSDANAQWTVTVSSGVATIKNCKYPAREIRYNTSAPRFACYKTGTQEAVLLYRRTSSTGISQVQSTAADSCVDVYTVSGVMVRRNVASSAALKGLAKGIYIIAGKKYAVE